MAPRSTAVRIRRQRANQPPSDSAGERTQELCERRTTMSYQFSAEGTVLTAPSRGDRETKIGSTKHFTGALVVGEGPGVGIGTESHLEMKAALLLYYSPATLDLIEQVRVPWRDKSDQLRDHYVDLVQTRKDGEIVGYAVRPQKRADFDYQCDLARIKEGAIGAGRLNDLRLFTEEDVCPIDLYNARLFHSVRRPDGFAQPVVADVIRKLPPIVTIGEIVEKSQLDGMGFREVVRLIRSEKLQLLRHERIDYASQVLKVGAF